MHGSDLLLRLILPKLNQRPHLTKTGAEGGGGLCIVEGMGEARAEGLGLGRSGIIGQRCMEERVRKRIRERPDVVSKQKLGCGV